MESSRFISPLTKQAITKTPFYTVTFLLILIFNPFNAQSQTLPTTTDIPDIQINMQLKKLTPHVFYVQGLAGIATDNKGFISNSAVIITDEGIVIFDALGTPSLSKHLVKLIREISDKPIKKIFISHYHADHFFGLQGLLSDNPKNPPTIYAPAGAQKYLSRDGAEGRLNERRKSLTPWVNKTTQLISADKYLSEDMQFSFGGLDIKILSFGSAHSDGDLSLYVKQDKVLITGDLVFTGRIPFIGGDNIQQWSVKIDELAKLPVQWIIPGHGAAFKNFEKGSRLTKNYLNLLHSIMTNGVDDLMSFDEIYSATNWQEFETLPAFKSGNRINAYRVFLNAEKTALDSQ